MNKIFRFAMSAAAAALALVSCQRNELAEVFSGPKAKVTIGVKPEEIVESTRTFLEEDAAGAYHAKWSNSGEALGLFLGDRTAASRPFVLTAEPTDDHDPIFTGEFSLEDGTYKMFIFYPSSAFFECDDEGAVGVDLKEVQTPDTGTFDPSCDLMGWSTDRVVVENGSLVLENIPLLRPMAILRLVLNADDDAIAKDMTVTGVRMEVEEGASSNDHVILTGRPYLNDRGQITGWGTISSSVEAEIDESSLITVGEVDFNEVFLVVNATTVPAGRKITFTVEGKNLAGEEIKFERVVSKDDEDMTFQAGKINSIGLKLRDKDLVGGDKEDFSGDWLITGVKNDVTYAAVAYASGNNIKATAPLTFSADGSTITSTADLSECLMTFTKETSGDYEGMYTIMDANGMYLYAAASSSNALKAKDEPDVNAYWTVVKEEGVYSIVASKSENRNVMRFNPNGSNDALVACYASADSQNPVTLYPASMISGLTDPLITFEGDENGRVEKTVPASTTSVEFSFTKNKYVTELPTVEKVGGLYRFDGDPVVSDNKITIPILANTSEDVLFIIVKVTGQGIDENGIILEIKQEAYEAPEALTMASLNSKIRTDNKTAAAEALEYTGTIDNVVVTGVKGDYAFAEDATGGILLFKVSGLAAGVKASGETTIKAYM